MMTRSRWTFVVGLSLMAFPVSGAEPANEATLSSNGKRLVFKNFVAVRGESYKEPRIIVLATGQKISADMLKKVQDKDAEDNVDSELSQPYLKLVFQDDGELRYLIGRGGNFSFMVRLKEDAGKVAMKDGRVSGTVKYNETGNFAKDAVMTFDLPLGAQAEKPQALEPAVKPTVTGIFTGEGKDGKLKFVSVHEHEPFNDKEAVTLVFTEKDHSASKKPSFDAGFGKFGNALILSVHLDGGVFGCEVAHTAHEKSPFSALGDISMEEFDITGGNVKGEVSTGGEVDAFDQEWEVDLKFSAPLPETMRAKVGKAATKSADKPKSATSEPDDDEPKPTKPAAPQLASRKLALPKSAKNIEYKQLVEHIQFKTDLPVAKAAEEFSASLKSQGWTDGNGGLIGQKNAILKRERDDASLTIMINPTGTGSLVKVFTEGLDWSDGNAAAGKEKDEDDDDDIEKAAKELIKKALKDFDDDDE